MKLTLEKIIRRAKWVLFERPLLQKRGTLLIDWSAYLCKESRLGKFGRLFSRASVVNSSIGHFSYVGKRSKVFNSKVGAFTSIGPDVLIGLGGHPTRWLTTHPSFYSDRNQVGRSFVRKSKFEESKPIVIGSDVWIGTRAMVLDGVEIGDGAIIAAGAVVTKNVSPYAVVGGVPARLIRYRFPSEVINALLNWKWWNLPVEVIEVLAEDFTQGDEWSIEKIRKLEKRSNDLLSKV